jgi:hypothetical protein
MRFALLLLAVIVAAAPQFAFAQFVTGSDEGVSNSATPKAKAAPKVKKAKAKAAPKAAPKAQ